MSRIIKSIPKHVHYFIYAFIFIIASTVIIVVGLTVSKVDLLNIFAAKSACGESTINSYSKLSSVGGEAHDKSYATLANQIKNTQKYKDDANCLYILTNYDIYMTNAKDARVNYNELKSLTDDGKTISQKLTSVKGSVEPSKLQSTIEGLEKAINGREDMG